MTYAFETLPNWELEKLKLPRRSREDRANNHKHHVKVQKLLNYAHRNGARVKIADRIYRDLSVAEIAKLISSDSGFVRVLCHNLNKMLHENALVHGVNAPLTLTWKQTKALRSNMNEENHD